jgi:N utilization substance protein A
MVQTEFQAALNQVASERGIEIEAVLDSIRTALISAYRKDYGGSGEDLTAEIDATTGEVKIFKEGKDVTPAGFGRIAAQTAKQVILQRIRESEKEAIISEYSDKVGQLVSGHIFRISSGVVVIDLGRAQGVMPPSEQIPNEHYRINQRIKVQVAEIREGQRGPEVIVSRARPEFVSSLFALEVPEIASGVVEIVSVAREAGERSKIAVKSNQENVDPVGSCVGQRGSRVQAVIAELGDEKVDIINYSSDPAKFIANALSPANVIDVQLDSEKKQASVEVFEDQLSLAIGKRGQNVRLAAKLTGWRIDIAGSGGGKPSADAKDAERELEAAGLSSAVATRLEKAGVSSLEELKKLSMDELKKIKGIGPKSLEEIQKIVQGDE